MKSYEYKSNLKQLSGIRGPNRNQLFYAPIPWVYAPDCPGYASIQLVCANLPGLCANPMGCFAQGPRSIIPYLAVNSSLLSAIPCGCIFSLVLTFVFGLMVKYMLAFPFLTMKFFNIFSIASGEMGCSRVVKMSEFGVMVSWMVSGDEVLKVMFEVEEFLPG